MNMLMDNKPEVKTSLTKCKNKYKTKQLELI